MTATISLPDEVLRKAEELAARERISLEELVVAPLSEQFAGVDSRGSRRRSIGFPMLNPSLTTECPSLARDAYAR